MNNLIQSIHLCLAAGNGCEVWHPEYGACKVLKITWDGYVHLQEYSPSSDINVFRMGGNRVSILKIILKPFAALVAEVDADPVDNAVVRAFSQARGLKGLEAKYRIGAIELRHPKDRKWMYAIESDFHVCAQESYFVVMPEYFQCLRTEGYPAGLPREHWISREEVEGGENG